MGRTSVLFSAHVVETDGFLEMPLDAQALYFHLCFEADADGFLSNARRTIRAIGADALSLEMLVDSGLLLQVEGCVMLVADWWLSNKYDKANHHKARTKLAEYRGSAVEFTGEEYKSKYRLVDGWKPTKSRQEGFQSPLIQGNTREDEGNTRETNSNPKEEKTRAEADQKATGRLLEADQKATDTVRPCPNCHKDAIAAFYGNEYMLECLNCKSLFHAQEIEGGNLVWMPVEDGSI